MSQSNDTKGHGELDESIRREQAKLIYDYIKFHIGLYLGTPAVFGLLGNVFGVASRPPFRVGLIVMICVYVIAGIHAGLFMGRHINRRWTSDSLLQFETAAFTLRRRIFHHWVYWFGLFAGLTGLVVATCK